MTSESIKLYKLIILYFLSQTRQPMSNAILSDFILEKGYTDYFSIQQTLTDLLDDEMIVSEQTHSTSYYTIAPKGLQMLDFFGKQLSKQIKNQINEYLEENKVTIVESTAIHTDFTQIKPNEYLAKGSILERGSVIFEVAVNVPSEEEALEACRRFKENHELIYSYVLQKMSID